MVFFSYIAVDQFLFYENDIYYYKMIVILYYFSGQHGDPRCVYVPPSTGQTFFSFRIAYARCGTKPGKIIYNNKQI